MVEEKADKDLAIEAVPALVGECFRGDEGVGGLSFALRDDGLYIKCNHSVATHEIKIA